MQTNQLIQELSRGLLSWYTFQKGGKALFITEDIDAYGVLADVLKENGLTVEVCSVPEEEKMSQSAGLRCYDYIVVVNALEYSSNPTAFLYALQNSLCGDGRLLLITDNRLGIRYFCGDKDAFTGHVFDGVDCYDKVNQQRRQQMKGRAYSKEEIKQMLVKAGFIKQKFYSVMPAVSRPQMLISENYIPNEVLDIRVFPQYQSPQTVFLEEEKLYDDLLKNDMFHAMANGFLIECSLHGELTDVDQITVSGDRGHDEALTTIIKNGHSVSKMALYEEGKGKIAELLDNMQYLKAHGVPVVEARVEQDAFVMPYIEGEIATEYLRKSLREDKDCFLAELETWKKIIEASSEAVSYEEMNWQQFEPGWEKRKTDDPNIDKWKQLAFGSNEERADIGVVLRKGFIDLVSLNCFHTESGYLFFDQEFYVENLPANVIFIRTIDMIYRNHAELEAILPSEEVLKHFKLWEHRSVWRKFTSVFLEKLRSEKELAIYHKQFRRDARIVAANRHRMDYTQEEHDRLFTNIFKDTEGKKIYLFGSGNYSEQFIRQFGDCYDIAGIVDNNESKWGTKLSDIEISSPEILREIQSPFRVFICIKFFDAVLEQLKSMGIKNLAVYDPRLEYERPLKQIVVEQTEEPKKYHVGYIAGVFDLFHIGHLNMFKRAKEQCDYLIVGVVSDEQVIREKKTTPYIPFEERLEIVGACKYVDEAVKIPADRPGTEEAYRLYHFDVQFSGSDYADDPVWLSKKAYLQQHGSDLVFFPYTQSTSSTKLKGKISGGKECR